MVRVKICCIASEAEAEMAIRHGAACVGLVSAMPSGPGPIADDRIAAIRRTIPPGVASFLLTCRSDAAGIVEQLRHTCCKTVQICDRLERGSYDDIRNAVPAISIVQVIHVVDETSLEEAQEAAAAGADAVLLDSGRPGLAIKELGGTGRTHDWRISRKIRERIDLPIYLAGGLNAANVGDAIRQVEPFAVDVCSGVRTDGQLDESKPSAFFRAVSAAS